MSEHGETTPNRLASESSPYLLQHAHNPVDWYPWGEEAIERARAEDLPILLSVGYAACHWCHVMERESFEDPQIAALMNRHVRERSRSIARSARMSTRSTCARVAGDDRPGRLAAERLPDAGSGAVLPAAPTSRRRVAGHGPSGFKRRARNGIQSPTPGAPQGVADKENVATAMDTLRPRSSSPQSRREPGCGPVAGLSRPMRPASWRERLRSELGRFRRSAEVPARHRAPRCTAAPRSQDARSRCTLQDGRCTRWTP